MKNYPSGLLLERLRKFKYIRCVQLAMKDEGESLFLLNVELAELSRKLKD